MSEHHVSYSPDQETGEIAEQAHAEITRLHEHALAELGQHLPRQEAKHARQGDEPPQGSAEADPTSS